jgi:Glutamate-1-semialdehyde aminotransferase
MNTSVGQKKTLKFTRSQELLAEGRELVAGFTQSMMKKPEQFALGRFPVYLQSGEGAEVTDVDGNRYIDYICGLGANALGHNHPAVIKAITDNLSKGIIHSLPTPVEITAARALTEIIPGAEQVRFFKTGADANSAAVRLARFITGKEKIVTVGYNGWHDHYMFDTPGVPQIIQRYTSRMPLFTPQDEQPLLDLINNESEQLAAVLLSVPYNRTLQSTFVNQLRDLCKAKDVLFILDEVVTGFRLALGGAQEYFNVRADLVTMSKGLAAGMPLSAVAGRRELMSQMEKLQVSTTFGGEMLSLEVCVAAIDEYRTSGYIQHIAELGRQLKSGVNAVAAELGTPLTVVGYDAIPMFLFSRNPQEHVKFAEPFVAEMAARGVLLRRDVNFISSAHTQAHIEHTIQAVRGSLEAMQRAGLFAAEERKQVSGAEA